MTKMNAAPRVSEEKKEMSVQFKKLYEKEFNKISAKSNKEIKDILLANKEYKNCPEFERIIE